MKKNIFNGNIDHESLFIKKFFSIIKKFLGLFVGPVLKKLYSPTTLYKDNNQDVIIKDILLEGNVYTIAQIKNGFIYTDRSYNISVYIDKKLIPKISWQYEILKNGPIILPDNKNKLLTGEIYPKRLPIKYNTSVVSLLTGGGGNYNYYHLLFDSISRLYLVKDFIKNSEAIKYLVPDNKYPFQKEIFSMLGISKENQISSCRHQHINASKLIATSHPNPYHINKIPNWILMFLRDKLLPHGSKETYGSFVYIDRRDSLNGRRLLNNEELFSALKKLGFKSYKLSELSVASQISLFANAKMIVGVHGGGFANLAFASKGTVVYELFSKNYIQEMYKNISKKLSLDYRAIYCSDFEHEETLQNASFRISKDDIELIRKHAEQIVRKYNKF